MPADPTDRGGGDDEGTVVVVVVGTTGGAGIGGSKTDLIPAETGDDHDTGAVVLIDAIEHKVMTSIPLVIRIAVRSRIDTSLSVGRQN